MNISAFGIRDIGQSREENEDYFYSSVDASPESGQTSGHLFVICDGVGGNRGGEIASRMACSQIPIHFYKNHHLPLAQRLTDALNLTDHDLRNHAANHPEYAEMSCTVLALAIHENEGVVAHMGDTRLYRLRQDELQLLTRDHSWVQQQVDSGRLHPDEAADHPNRNVILRSLGGLDKHPVEIGSVDIKEGDRYLLASDGLTGPVPYENLHHFIRLDQPLASVAQEMIANANAFGGPDNICAVLVQQGTYIPRGTSSRTPTYSSERPPTANTAAPEAGPFQVPLPSQPAGSAVTKAKSGSNSSRAVWWVSSIVGLLLIGVVGFLLVQNSRTGQSASSETASQESESAIVASANIPDPDPTSTLASLESTASIGLMAEPTSTLAPTPEVTAETPRSPEEGEEGEQPSGSREGISGIIGSSGGSDEDAAPDAEPENENEDEDEEAGEIGAGAAEQTEAAPNTGSGPITLDIGLACQAGPHLFGLEEEIEFKWIGTSSAELARIGGAFFIVVRSAETGDDLGWIPLSPKENQSRTPGEWIITTPFTALNVVESGPYEWYVEQRAGSDRSTELVEVSETNCFDIG